MTDSTPSRIPSFSPDAAAAVSPVAVSLQRSSPAAPLSPGVLLQQARQGAGVDLESLSVALKVPVRHLVALEADEHSALSGPVFVRALTRSVCRHLGVDAAPILVLLPPATTSLKTLPPGLEPADPGWRDRFLDRLAGRHRLFLMMAFGLMLLIALVVWMPPWPGGSAAIAVPPVAATPIASEHLLPVAPPANPMVVLMPSDISSETAAGTAIPSAKILSGTSAPAATQAALLELTFKGRLDESWVEVRDASGTVVFSKLIKVGETHVVKAAPVLTVVVGLAEAVDVLVRGQSLDLTPFSRGAVARFEVK